MYDGRVVCVLTVKDVDPGSGWRGPSRFAGVVARVPGSGSLDEEGRAGHLACLRHHAHSTPRRVVVDLLVVVREREETNSERQLEIDLKRVTNLGQSVHAKSFNSFLSVYLNK